jgi:hypothetical protein
LAYAPLGLGLSRSVGARTANANVLTFRGRNYPRPHRKDKDFLLTVNHVTYMLRCIAAKHISYVIDGFLLDLGSVFFNSSRAISGGRYPQRMRIQLGGAWRTWSTELYSRAGSPTLHRFPFCPVHCDQVATMPTNQQFGTWFPGASWRMLHRFTFAGSDPEGSPGAVDLVGPTPANSHKGGLCRRFVTLNTAISCNW